MSCMYTWRVVTVPCTGTFAVFKYLSVNYMTNFVHLLSHISLLLPFFKADQNIHARLHDVVTSKQDREWWENYLILGKHMSP